MLRSIAQSPAMLSFLDNEWNTFRRVNENYARELCELHTIGVGNYTQADVVAAARANTGWRLNRTGAMEHGVAPFGAFFDTTTHVPGSETFLGKTVSNMDDVLTVLLASPSGSLPLAAVAPAGVMGLLVEPVLPSTLRATVEVAVRRHQESLALRREGETLQRTLESRKLIERAKGLLMELDSIHEEEAFVRIRQKSMDTQRPMADIARAIILAAELTGRGRGAYAPRS